MRTKRFLQLLSLASLCLLLTSCIDSKVPLSDPDKSKADERLAGVWRFEGKERQVSYYHIGRFGDRLPKSVMRAVGITHTQDGEIKSAGELLIFPTTIGEKTYLNICDGKDKQMKLLEEKGWTAKTPAFYLIFRYQITGDELVVQAMDAEAKKRAIQDGKVEGVIEKNRFTKVFFTDTTENLAKFVGEAGDDLFSKDVVRLDRVK